MDWFTWKYLIIILGLHVPDQDLNEGYLRLTYDLHSKSC